MSDTTERIVLSTLRTKLHEAELAHVQLAGRIMELRDCIALIEHGPGRRRPRKIHIVNPMRVAGGTHEEDALPSLDAVRGILKETA